MRRMCRGLILIIEGPQEVFFFSYLCHRSSKWDTGKQIVVPPKDFVLQKQPEWTGPRR